MHILLGSPLKSILLKLIKTNTGKFWINCFWTGIWYLMLTLKMWRRNQRCINCVSQNCLSAEKLPFSLWSRQSPLFLYWIKCQNRKCFRKSLKQQVSFVLFQIFAVRLFRFKQSSSSCSVIACVELVSLQYCFILITVVLVCVTCKSKQKS